MLCLALGLPSLLAATAGDRWKEVGQKEVLFAQGLTREQVRYGPELTGLINGTIEACRPAALKLSARSEKEIRLIELYCTSHCEPWREAWADALAPCEEDHRPKWCDDPKRAGQELHFGPYFQVLTEALGETSDALERFNIMAVMAERLDRKVVRDYPRSDIDGWVANATTAYLHGADSQDVIEIAQRLGILSFGKRSVVAQVLLDYANRSNLTQQQERSHRAAVDALREKPDE
jgi:hypothetical protein